METRTVTQAKIYKLFLMDMRLGEMDLAALSYDKAKLLSFLLENTTEPYSESEEVEVEEGKYETLTFDKVYKKDGPLEWFTAQTYTAEEIPTQWINESDLEEFRSVNPQIPFID